MRTNKFVSLVSVIITASILTLAFTSCSMPIGVQETIETTLVPTATPTPTPEPTATPTPTNTPMPTPSPTPVPEYVEPEFEETWYNGFVDARSVRAVIVQNPDDITVLVNKYFALPLDYVPSDLVAASHSGGQQVRAEVNEQWCAMYDACVEATGQGLYLVSGYRDSNIQNYLFYRSTNLRGIEFSVRKNAVPGRSEHQLGLAIDITPAGESEILDEFGETRTGMWVNEHCYEFGFIRRFQYEYRYETGYDQEAWHYRYVGVELATYLYENDMSLEAYYGLEQVLPWDE
ncbi:MAG: M15 family metallopeptidase [Saccharofermentans sp.]|nr:M15 family metallopeptidase [Saccharofermentans sp.]